MSKHAAERGTAQTFVEARRANILEALERPAAGPDFEPLARVRLDFLLREAKELYWNEMAWEQLTDEEAIAGGHLTELVFPGFLTFVDGLLLNDVPDNAPAPAAPHPDAVEKILSFLGEQWAAFTAQLEAGADSQRLVWARLMTARLVDLVLYRLYCLSPAEREAADAGR